MSSTKNHKPLANYKKVAKLDQLSRKFDLPYNKEISPLNKTDLIGDNDIKKIIKNFSKFTKSEVITLTTLEKKSISKIKAKLISYAS